jgi:hypothetical protein
MKREELELVILGAVAPSDSDSQAELPVLTQGNDRGALPDCDGYGGRFGGDTEETVGF